MKNIPLQNNANQSRTPHKLKTFNWLIAASAALFCNYAIANCTVSGSTTTCDTNAPDPFTSTIGSGNTSAGDGQTVIVNAGSTVSTGNASAISLRDTANITIYGTVQNASTNASGGYGAGGNTIEFRDNGHLTIESGGRVASNGTQGSAEAINVMGTGNTITNNGTIFSTSSAAAIWNQNGGSLTIVNNGTITRGFVGSTLQSIGGTGTNDFTNNGTVNGSISFGTGSDIIRLYTGSNITGSVSGGTGGAVDSIYLNGAGNWSTAQAVNGTISLFNRLYKQDSGTWTWSNSIAPFNIINVEGGTLILTGSIDGYTGTTTVNSGATLQGQPQNLPNSITDNGIVRFDQPSGSGIYSGVISGTGSIDKIGAGTVTISGVNTYTGSTTISEGTLALADSGSITASNLVTNNASFDIQQKTTDTTLGGNYVQSSTGTLKMGLSTSNVEKLVITGTATLAGGLYVNAAAGHYNAGRYTLLNAQSGLSGTFSSFTNNFDAALSKYHLGYDANDVFLYVDQAFNEVDKSNTVQSVNINAAGLSTIYNQQIAAYQAALTYDCRLFDEHNLCVSVGGRYTYAGPSPSANQQAGLVVLGYKPSRSLRIGAFADQSVNTSTPSGFSQSKTSPMWGLFAKWHMNTDEIGLGVQASAVTSASSLNITRPQLINTEAGSGTTQFNGQGYQLTTNYHQPVTEATALVPYIGLRYTRATTGAYSETLNAFVTSPLSYNAMSQNTFSAIGGIGIRSLFAEKLTGTASVGIQQNLKYSMSNYQVNSTIVGLESFNVAMPGNVNSMATATAGLSYDINKHERVGLNVLWQQQPFIASNTTTALATYTIGF